jgi:MoxR-like ATPase
MEESTGAFVRWTQKAQERSKNIGGYIVTPEVEKYTFLIELLVNSHQPVLITGQPGVGKSTLVQVYCIIV